MDAAAFFNLIERDYISIPLERMKDVEVRIFKSHLQRSSLHDVP